jgi:hypothetical protein
MTTISLLKLQYDWKTERNTTSPPIIVFTFPSLLMVDIIICLLSLAHLRLDLRQYFLILVISNEFELKA